MDRNVAFSSDVSDVNQVLNSHHYIKSALAKVRWTSTGPKIVAYIVPSTLLSRSEVVQHCRENLPEHRIPAAVVFMPCFPCKQDGEVDYEVLWQNTPPKIDEASEQSTGMEEAHLEQTFAGTLGLERIGREDNFFDLGGHSLLATRIVSALNSRFGTSLTLNDILSYPTVASLAARLKSLK